MKNIRTQAGFTALELLGVLAVGIVILASIPKFVQEYSREMQARALASYVAEYNSAVAQWLEDNRTVIPNGVVNQAGVDWLKETVQCGGAATAALNYLPCAFPAVAPFGVAVNTQIVAALPLITATSTFGPPITIDGQVDQPLISKVVAESRANANTRVSVSQTFNQDLVANTIVSVADTNNPGDPWLRLDGTSTMAGDLDMGGNNINNVNDINGTGNWTTLGDVTGDDFDITSIGESASEGVYNIAVVSHGSVVAKPACPAGLNAQIFLSPFQYSGNITTEPIGAVQSWATDNGASWTTNLRILLPTPIGWINPNATFGKMNAITKCG